MLSCGSKQRDIRPRNGESFLAASAESSSALGGDSCSQGWVIQRQVCSVRTYRVKVSAAEESLR